MTPPRAESPSSNQPASANSSAADAELKALSVEWLERSSKFKYSYNFKWMGRPIIQYPQDIVALQEIIWDTKPDLIIETGIAHGGSLIFYASMLQLLGGDGHVLGIDIDIRAHNRVAIEEHPLSNRISMIEGSSVDASVIEQIAEYAKKSSSTMVILDSNHTRDHVLQELQLYSSFVTKDNYLVVLDTAIELMPAEFFTDRPWGKGNNSMIAVQEFLQSTDSFALDSSIEEKLLITVAPGGYLRRIKDDQ